MRGARLAAGSCAIMVALTGMGAFVLQLAKPAGAVEAPAGGAPDTFAPLADAEFRAARVPKRLSETGLYLADGAVDPRNRPFAPQYPLWTDGAAKSRWIRLPEGATIDASDVDAWRFPPGTTFWKEFAWAGRRVETRMIRVESGGRWTFASYVWNDAQTEAFLAPELGVRGVHAIAPGRRHSIPAVADCQTCHGSTPAVVLGFGALQLSDARDPLAPNAEPLPRGAITLRTLVAEGRLSPARPELASRPPQIRGRDAVERASLGYLYGNCAHCHNDRGPLARLGVSFRHDVAAAATGAPEPGLVTTHGARSRFVIPGAAPESAVVIAPGAPDRSALLHRMGSRRPSSQMPPLGTVIADSAAVALVGRWIERLGAAPTAAVPPPPRGR